MTSLRAGSLALLAALVIASPAVATVPDGGLIRTPDGRIHRVIGGSPLWISRCNYTNSCAGTVQAPDLAGYLAFPRDGALAGNVDDGGIYRFAGGAPEWLSRCDYGPGCPVVYQIDSWSFQSGVDVRHYPADGTLVENVDDHGIYRFAGGAPELVTRCNYGGGCAGGVPLDGGTFAQRGSLMPGYKTMRDAPADGTLVRNVDEDVLYRFAAGAPLAVTRCDYGGGCDGPVLLDGGSFSNLGTATAGQEHMASRPPDGTFLQVAPAGQVYRLAGGAPVAIHDCAPIGGCDGAYPVDEGTIAGRSNGRLAGVPADGTVLLGQPSGQRWEIVGGHRRQTFVNAAGVAVDDAAVAAFPLDTSDAPSPPTPHPTPKPARFAPVVAIYSSTTRRVTHFTMLAVRGLPAGSKVVVTCTGRGCPFKRRALQPRKGRVDVRKAFGHAGLRTGAVVKITLTGPTGARKVTTFRMRTGKVPVRVQRCARSGGKLAAC